MFKRQLRLYEMQVLMDYGGGVGIGRLQLKSIVTHSFLPNLHTNHAAILW